MDVCNKDIYYKAVLNKKHNTNTVKTTYTKGKYEIKYLINKLKNTISKLISKN